MAIASSLLIDLDHVFLLVAEKAYTFKKIKRVADHIYDKPGGRPNRAYVDILYPFHTVEFNVVLLLLSTEVHWLLYVAIGFAFHICCDALHDYYEKLPVFHWLFWFNWLASGGRGQPHRAR